MKKLSKESFFFAKHQRYAYAFFKEENPTYRESKKCIGTHPGRVHAEIILFK